MWPPGQQMRSICSRHTGVGWRVGCFIKQFIVYIFPTASLPYQFSVQMVSNSFYSNISPKGNQPWIFIGKTDAEAEAPILWPLDGKSRLIRNDPDAGKDRRQEKKGATEGELVGWHHNGHEFEQALGDGKGQRGLVCYSPWGCTESDITWRTEQHLKFGDHFTSSSPWLHSPLTNSLFKKLPTSSSLIFSCELIYLSHTFHNILSDSICWAP